MADQGITSIKVRFYNQGSFHVFEHYGISAIATAEHVAKQLAALFSEVYLVSFNGEAPVKTTRVLP